MTEYLRLVLATGVVVLPGWAIARALGRRGAAATVVWALVAVALALAVTFAVHASLRLTLALELAIGLVALLVSGRRGARRSEPSPAAVAVLLGGVAFGIALWQVCGPIGGDGLFHLARVRKLEVFGDLSLRRVDEFRDGGLHPGYAFPLWHGFLALVAKVSGLDPAVVVRYEPTVLVPLVFLVLYEAGCAVFERLWGGVAVLLGTVALYALAPGHGGAYVFLGNPGTAVRQLLAPAALAAVFAAITRGGGGGAWATVAAAALVAALVHPAFAAFVLLPLGGYLLARALLERGDVRRSAAAVAAYALPLAGVLLWLRPVVDDTAAVSPGADERARALAQYGDQLVVHGTSYRLAPEVVARGGAVAVAALVAVPLAGLAGRRRWAALVLGGTLVVLALTLVPALFTHFSDAVSLSQSRRAAGFVPFAVAFAGGAWALARLGPLGPAAALALGVVFQWAWPGDFGGRLLADGGPAAATWIAAIGGAAALVAAALRPREGPEVSPLVAVLTAAAFVAPVAVHGFSEWTPAARVGAEGLTPGLVRELRTRVPAGAVVFGDLETSYRVAALAPVYVAAAPPAHVANTGANRPYERRRAVRAFLRTGDLAIPRRFGATWLVVDRRRVPRGLRLRPVYEDARYALFRLAASARSPRG